MKKHQIQITLWQAFKILYVSIGVGILWDCGFEGFAIGAIMAFVLIIAFKIKNHYERP